MANDRHTEAAVTRAVKRYAHHILSIYNHGGGIKRQLDRYDDGYCGALENTLSVMDRAACEYAESLNKSVPPPRPGEAVTKPLTRFV